MILKAEKLDCGYTRRINVRAASFTLDSGQFLCLLGPNGSGKTSLLKTLAGLLPVRGGRFEIDGVDMASAPAKERAGLLAYVPQSHAPIFPFAVLDVVVMGRAGRWQMWAGPSSGDWEAAEAALETTGMSGFAMRPYSQLSGGERQMVMIARALAQGASFLALDEPASSLDFGNQTKMLNMLRNLAASGKGIVMASHNPEHAMRCADSVAVVHRHRLECLGDPVKALTPERLQAIYDIRFLVSHVTDAFSNRIPVCVPEY